MQKVLKNHFIPHVGNDYSPHILQRAAMLAMLGLVLLTFTIANLQALIWVNVDWLVSAVLPAVVVAETNNERAGGNLGTVTRSAALDQAAQLKAEHMARNGYFAHYAPDGTSPWYWFEQVGYSFVNAGENLAVHFNDSQQVMQAWMSSPTHRANIMNKNFTQIGIGVAEGTYDGYDTVFVVQLFGTPAATVASAEASDISVDAVTVINEQVSEPIAVVADTQTVASAEETVVESIATPPVTEEETVYTLPSTTEDRIDSEESLIEVATSTPLPEDKFSGFISTSTNAVPANIESNNEPASNRDTSFALATQPQQVLQFLYIALALFILTALTLSILLEFKRQQPLQIAYSLGLLAVMGGLYYIHSLATTAITIV